MNKFFFNYRCTWRPIRREMQIQTILNRIFIIRFFFLSISSDIIYFPNFMFTIGVTTVQSNSICRNYFLAD